MFLFSPSWEWVEIILLVTRYCSLLPYEFLVRMGRGVARERAIMLMEACTMGSGGMGSAMERGNTSYGPLVNHMTETGRMTRCVWVLPHMDLLWCNVCVDLQKHGSGIRTKSSGEKYKETYQVVPIAAIAIAVVCVFVLFCFQFYNPCDHHRMTRRSAPLCLVLAETLRCMLVLGGVSCCSARREEEEERCRLEREREREKVETSASPHLHMDRKPARKLFTLSLPPPPPLPPR